MAIKTPISVPVPNPFLDSGSIANLTDIGDALNNATAMLFCLSDLFCGDNDKYPVLDSEAARLGMWLQLFGIARTLEAISKAIQHIEK